MYDQIIYGQIIDKEEYRETQMILVDFCFDRFCFRRKLKTDTLEEGSPRLVC
jgi:hypothetical protein